MDFQLNSFYPLGQQFACITIFIIELKKAYLLDGNKPKKNTDFGIITFLNHLRCAWIQIYRYLLKVL